MNKNTQQPPVWRFSHWTRNPWAAFVSLRRFCYGHLSVAMSIILLATHIAGAQVPGADSVAITGTLHLDSVRITARGGAVLATDVSQTRFLVDQKGKAPLAGAEALLRLLPAIDIRERGGRSTQADIAIRGGSFDQTQVMLAGIDFSDARTGHQSHSLPVDLDILSDIAVLEGAARPGALAGVVDFRTAPAYPRYLRARLEGGAWGYGYGNLSGASTHNMLGGRTTAFGAASYRRSDGYRHNTDFWNTNAYARVIHESRRAGEFDIQGGFQRREWGSNGFYHLKWPDQFESTSTGLGSLRWNKTWNGLKLEAKGSFRQNNDRYELVRGNASKVPFNHHVTMGTAASLAASYDRWIAGTTTVGAGWTRNTMYSSNMGVPLDDPQREIPGTGGMKYARRAGRDIVSVWLGHEKLWRSAWFRGQATLNDTPYGTEGTFFAEAGTRNDNGTTLKTSVLRSMRLPTFTELYYNVTGYHPDPNLRPETAMTYRLTAMAGGENSSKGFSGEASVWYRTTKKVIDWEQHPDPGPVGHPDYPGKAGDWWSTQLNRLGTVGAEISTRYTADGWLRAASVSYGWLHSDMTVASDYISKYALDYMRHKLSGVVSVMLLREVTLTMIGSYYDRTGSWIGGDDIRYGYRPYFLVDGRLSWEPRRTLGPEVQLYLDGTNLLGTRYADFGGLPMPGCWLSAGVVLTLR